MEEIWKKVRVIIGPYSVSDYGKIKNYKTGQILKPSINGRGYYNIDLCKNNNRKTFLVHRLILETFVGPCPEGMECRHLDGNPKNNKLENLKWGTPKENYNDRKLHGTDRYGFKIGYKYNIGSKCVTSKLNEKQVRIIKYLLMTKILTPKEITKIFDISKYIISLIKRNKSWKHVNNIFRII